MLVLTALFVFSAVAQDDDDEYAPRRRRPGWRSQALSRTLSINLGLWAALEAKIATDRAVYTIKPEEPDYLFSIGAKLWFYRSNWGIGVDAVLLDTETFEENTTYIYWDGYGWAEDSYTETFSYQKWMIDLNLYYRWPIIRSLQAIGGVGVTFIRHVYDGAPDQDDYSFSAGYNLKLGGELFVARSFSVSMIFTWHHFKDDGITTADAVSEDVHNTVKMLSVTAQLNLYL